MTHTVTTLEVTERTYQEIADKLRAAGYEYVFMHLSSGAAIDMTGIAIAPAPAPIGPICTCAMPFGPHYCEIHSP